MGSAEGQTVMGSAEEETVMGSAEGQTEHNTPAYSESDMVSVTKIKCFKQN